MKKLMIFMIFMIFICLTILSYQILSLYKDDHTQERCKAEISFIRGGEKMNIVAFQSMASGMGVLSISGFLFDGKRTSGYLSKTISFSYQRMGDEYLVRSEIISNSPQMTLTKKDESKWFPPFFYSVGKSLIWKIIPIDSRSSLTFSESIPLYVCEKTS